MHARRYHWMIITVVAATTTMAGCRGTRPLGNLVKMSKTPDEAGLPEVEAPKQRLAVNKPQADSPTEQEKASAAASLRSKLGGLTGRGQKQDDNPHVAKTASNAKPTSPRRRPDSDTIAANFPSHKNPMTQLASSKKATAKKASAKETAALPDKPIEEMTPDDMSKAFENQPEEVKRLAMRQLMASMQADAEKSFQPKPVDGAIAESVNSLPNLPEPTAKDAKPPAQRIASDAKAAADKEATGNEQMANAVEKKMASIQPEKPAQARLSDALGDGKTASENDSDLEAVVVQSISDASPEGTIQPASAARSDDQAAMVAQASVASPSADLPAVGEMTDQALYTELLERLSKAAPGETEAQRAARLIKQRHLLVLAGDPDGAVEKVSHLSNHEQEYLRHQLLGLWTMVDPEGHPVPSRRFTTALPQLREATKFAAAATDSLDVRSLAFCTAIESYGQIKTFPGNRFEPGQQVILYCEVENFTVAKTAEGFETNLQGSYDIFNDKNEKVVSQLLPADVQTSANYLRDYFIAYQMHLPAQLEPGTYRLQLTMEDVGGKKYGQASIPLEIATK